MMNIALISHPDCLLHDMEQGLPEIPARVQVIQEALWKSPLAPYLKQYMAPSASIQDLSQAHDPQYIQQIFAMAPQQGLLALDPDTWMNPYSLRAALHAAGSVIMAVDLVMKEEVNVAFCNVRPPGHHAERAQAMGFCLFNNVAVGVLYALNHYPLKRIAIIDFDVHHGNGTEAIFKKDERVLYCSSFEYPLYPMTGIDTLSSHILNVPLEAGTDSQHFREKIATAWFAAIDAFNPDMLFFSAGFDAYYRDEISSLLLTEEDYTWITAEIVQRVNAQCQKRIISVLEGGYVLATLGDCVLAHLTGLLDQVC